LKGAFVDSKIEKKNIIKCLQKASGEAFTDFKGNVLGKIDKKKTEISTKSSKFSSNFIRGMSKESWPNKIFGRRFKDQDILLPEGTIFFDYVPYKDIYVVVIEQEPQVRTLNFNRYFFERDYDYFRYKYSGTYPGKERSRLQLAFPYMVFVLALYKTGCGCVYVFYLNKPITSFEDKVYPVNIPNCYESGSACVYLDNYDPGDTLLRKVEISLGGFWGGRFNTDGSTTYHKMQGKDRRFANIWEWEKNSLEEPSFVLKVDWKTYEYVLGERIEFFARTLNFSEKIFISPDKVLIPETQRRIYSFAVEYGDFFSGFFKNTSLFSSNSHIVFPRTLRSELSNFLLKETASRRKELKAKAREERRLKRLAEKKKIEKEKQRRLKKSKKKTKKKKKVKKK